MLQHLRNLMHESTMYPWEGVRKFHGTVLRLMEQDRRLGLTKPWSMSYVPNTPVHQGPLPAIVAMLHSHAPAQSSRKGRVPTARTTSRPMAVRLLMSVDDASVSSGSTINIRRTVSPKRNGTKKNRGNRVTPISSSALTTPDDDPHIMDSLFYMTTIPLQLHGHLQWSTLIVLIPISHPALLITHQSTIGYTMLCTVLGSPISSKHAFPCNPTFMSRLGSVTCPCTMTESFQNTWSTVPRWVIPLVTHQFLALWIIHLPCVTTHMSITALQRNQLPTPFVVPNLSSFWTIISNQPTDDNT